MTGPLPPDLEFPQPLGHENGQYLTILTMFITGDWFIACSQTSLGAMLAKSGVPVYQYVFNYTSAR